MLVKQRILGIVAGYEDVNDHETLRDDALLALACGQEDLVGAHRPRERDRGHALAGKSTLNRLEHAVVEERPSRYRRVALDPAAIEGQFVDCMIKAHDEVPERIVLDLDATDDPVHGHEEGRFFHGYYRGYCYLPLYIFCGDHLLCAKLRPANQDGAVGSVEEVARIVDQIRSHWPEVEIWSTAKIPIFFSPLESKGPRNKTSRIRANEPPARTQLPFGPSARLLSKMDQRAVNLDEKVEVGKRVGIIGGGNAAVDAARIARRIDNCDYRYLYK